MIGRIAGPTAGDGTIDALSERALDVAWHPRTLALTGAGVLTASYLAALYHVVDVVGSPGGTLGYLGVVVGSLVLAAVCARSFGARGAVLLGAGLLVVGLAVYLLSVPGGSVDLEKQAADTVSLLAGLSVLRVTRAGVWALGLTPGPVFLSWYFLGRRAYAAGTLVGGGALAVFVLTGDVGTTAALVGVLGGVAAVGFGQVDRDGADPELGRTVVVLLVAMLVVTTSASFVPGGEARPLLPGGGSTTVEASLTEADASADVVGSIALSPELRFSVEAEEPSYWRVGAYDRYTGDGWVRTGPNRAYDGPLPRPEAADVRPLRQTVTAESDVSTMPAAWKPVGVEDAPGPVEVTDMEGISPRGGLQAGERYSVLSYVPERSPARLRRADGPYPAGVEARYLGLPGSTPERLGRFTENLTADAETPYEQAVAIEAWLEDEKEYSLSVDRPSGDVASAFVFEMDAGYCTYYATAMVAMLRTQGVPARFVVGYLPGEQADGDEWLVRGLDSHAWVEVYLPDVGWVQFDPTPAGPREAAEEERLTRARSAGEPNVDPSTSPGAVTPFRPVNETGLTPANGTENGTGTPGRPNGTAPAGTSDDGVLGPLSGWGSGGWVPPTETVLYGLVLVLGVVTASYRLGLVDRLHRAFWLRRLPDGPPAMRIDGAMARAEYLLARRYRPRRDGETRRAYLDAVRASAREGDAVVERAATLFQLGERARYAGQATEREASEARRLLRSLRAETGRLG